MQYYINNQGTKNIFKLDFFNIHPRATRNSFTISVPKSLVARRNGPYLKLSVQFCPLIN